MVKNEDLGLFWLNGFFMIDGSFSSSRCTFLFEDRLFKIRFDYFYDCDHTF